jgi:hypothetical protein
MFTGVISNCCKGRNFWGNARFDERRLRAAAKGCKWYTLSTTFHSLPGEAIYHVGMEDRTREGFLYQRANHTPSALELCLGVT